MNLQMWGIRLAPLLTLVFALSVLGGLVAIFRARRQARTTEFGVLRENASFRAKRWMIRTGLLAVLGGASTWLWAVSVWRPEALPTPAPTPTLTPIPSPTPRPPTATPTSAATSAPTATLTVEPTATSTANATVVPTNVELPSALRRAQPSDAAAPGSGAVLVEVVMAAGEQENMPVDPNTTFAPGTRRVYAFMFFDGMADSVPWTHVWYGERDGQMQEIWGKTELWSYEYSRGRIWRYFDCGVGNYELHIYVGRQLQQKVPFVIRGG